MSQNKSKIEKLRNKYNGEKIFIVGNGPSLSQTPLNNLSNEHTLAMNKIGLIYSRTSWRPSFYYYMLPPDHKITPADKSIITRNIKSKSICFLNSKWRQIIGEKENVIYIDRWSLHGKSPFDAATMNDIATVGIPWLQEFWSNDISNFVYHYHSMYGAIQTAIYIGFDELYFIGCDLGMEYRNPHMICKEGLDPYRYNSNKYVYLREAINKNILPQSLINAFAMLCIEKFNNRSSLEYLFGKNVDDHFCPDYFNSIFIDDGATHEAEIRKSHLAIKRICDEKNIETYNATIGGELDIYPRVELDAIIDRQV